MAFGLSLVGPAGGPATPEATAAPPHFFVGLQGWHDPPPSVIARLQRAEVHSYRLNLSWSRIERTRGQYGWRYYDELFLGAARAGIRLLPLLFASPAWVCNPSCVNHKPQYPPRTEPQRNRFYSFVHRAARRYGPNGYFWNGKDVPVSSRPKWFQVWNEPNIPEYWNGRPNADEYARLLKQSGIAVRDADPDARVLAAGLPQPLRSRRYFIPIGEFIRRIFARPGLSRVVDGVAIHPYSPSVSGIFDRLDTARAALRGLPGESTKSLFITEFGWATGGGTPGIAVTRTEQAERLGRAYSALLARRKEYRLAGAYWFSYGDRLPAPGEHPWWGIYTGLFDRFNQPKPSWREFLRVTGGRP